MAQFDYKKFLKEGGVEKYLMEADFGNSPEDRWAYIQPLLVNLPDTARTETLIDGMKDGLAEDDKELFDYYFVEAMKELGLEQELMEPEDVSDYDSEVAKDWADEQDALYGKANFVEEGESLINPEAEEIDAEDLDAAADYFDSLEENDDVLDEIIDEGFLDRLKAKAKGVGAGVKQAAKNVKAGVAGNKEDIKSVKSASQTAKLKSITDDVNKDLEKAKKDLVKLFKGAGEDEGGGKYDPKVIEMAKRWGAKVKELQTIQQQMLGTDVELEEGLNEGDIQVGDLVYFKGHEDKVPMQVLKVRRMFGSNLDAITTEKGEYDETQLVRAKRAVDMGDGTFQVSELEGEVQTEEVDVKPGMVQKGNITDAIKLLNHIQYEFADAFSDESMDSVSDVIVMLNQIMKQQ